MSMVDVYIFGVFYRVGVSDSLKLMDGRVQSGHEMIDYLTQFCEIN
jgi:hypothetical protein